MHSNISSKSIILAGNRMLYSQMVFGSITLLYLIVFKSKLDIESAFIGISIAIAPLFMGTRVASYKAKRKPEYSLKDLLKLSRNIKVIYTIVMFIFTFRFMAVNQHMVLAAYCITVLGLFLSPMFKEQQ
ncbi:ATP synthase subunit I [Vibrio sp. SCSIO 43140]|uniref:ATP synthase subunit I n=1 Tax=Vibrio sp. SCSIO 43140 TaxID=2819100 RepID=UPI002074B774|nr:ATP synthase subunit I [Vibrio sp. SCSIO 43140]USD61692.1 ATP synthase subunit I [Vibrio sp. SCSIO 43140]